jgi:hypothetical protein
MPLPYPVKSTLLPRFALQCGSPLIVRTLLAGPKSKIKSNGVGGLRTYISFF